MKKITGFELFVLFVIVYAVGMACGWAVGTDHAVRSFKEAAGLP